MMPHGALSAHAFHPAGPGLLSPPPPPAPAVPLEGAPQQRDEWTAPELGRRTAAWLRPVLIAVTALVGV